MLKVLTDRMGTAAPEGAAGGRRTVAALLSATILSAVVWGLVVFFDLH